MLEQTTQQIITNYLNPLAMLMYIILGLIKMRDAHKKGGNPYNYLLAAYFLSIVLGLVINVLYVTFQEQIPPNIYEFLPRVSVFFIILGVYLPLVFLLALEKGFQGFSEKTRKQVTYASLVNGLFFFVGDIRVELDYSLIYDRTLVITAFIILGGYLSYFLTHSIRLIRGFKKGILKRKFSFFVIGYCLSIGVLVNSVLMLGGLIDKQIAALIMAFGLLISGSLIYLGIGKKLQENPEIQAE